MGHLFGKLYPYLQYYSIHPMLSNKEFPNNINKLIFEFFIINRVINVIKCDANSKSLIEDVNFVGGIKSVALLSNIGTF